MLEFLYSALAALRAMSTDIRPFQGQFSRVSGVAAAKAATS
jgi:hypothetical protein